MSAVVLEHVTKNYGKYVAVEDVSLCAADGEFVVLLGPSGSGKSTTLLMIAGLEELTDGAIYFDDVPVQNVPPERRDTAMVFQNYALYPHMTVYQNMAFGLRMRGTPRGVVAERIRAAAETLGLSEQLSKRPAALSGGQRQRVALGRAMVRKPKVFLMDEPLSNLDAKLRSHMRLEIRQLQRSLGATFIYVTHDQVEAMTMADRVIVFNEGKIEQVGSPEDIYARPATTFVASFVGSPEMNLMPCTIYRDARRARLVIDENFQLHGEAPEWLLSSHQNGVLGLRPQELLVAESPRSQDTVLARVLMKEPMGAELYLHVNFGRRLTVRSARQRHHELGDLVALDISQVTGHFFDEGGVRLGDIASLSSSDRGLVHEP